MKLEWNDGCLSFDRVGWGEEQVGLTVDYTAPCPCRVCARLLGGERLGAWDPLLLSFLSPGLRLSFMPVLSLVSRCCTCTVTLARCPSVVSVQWAGTGATASSISRRHCRTPGHSPSSCWLTPSRAARRSRSVLPSPTSLCVKPFPLPFRWRV